MMKNKIVAWYARQFRQSPHRSPAAARLLAPMISAMPLCPVFSMLCRFRIVWHREGRVYPQAEPGYAAALLRYRSGSPQGTVRDIRSSD